MVKEPEEDEVRSVATLVAILVAMTVASGMTAPVLSVTVPVMVPCTGGLRLQCDWGSRWAVRGRAGRCLA